MPTVDDITTWLREFAPLDLAEDWDNVGLLVGATTAGVERVMTCLTLTPDVAREAIEGEADLVVTHHPVLFRPVQRLTDETREGRVLLDLIAAGTAVYSPHTAFDSCRDGINASIATSLELTELAPLRPALNSESAPSGAGTGGGRSGRLPEAMSLAEFFQQVKTVLKVDQLQFVGDPSSVVERVAVACGSAAEFLADAKAARCDVLLTGEARFHACLDARTLGIALVLAGHYATERPAVEQLALRLARQFPAVNIWASDSESDPVQWSWQ